MYKNFLI